MSRFCTVLLVLVALMSAAMAAQKKAINVPALLKRVDAAYYYPQRHGLRDLSVKISVPELERQFAAQKITPKITFYWKAPKREKFVVSGFPQGQEAARDAVIQMLKGRGAVIVSTPNTEALKDYKLTAAREKGLTVVRGTAKDPKSGMGQLALWFRGNELTRMDADRAGANVRITSIKTIKKGGQMLPSAMHGLVYAQSKSHPITTTFSYSQLKGIWLVDRIVSTVDRQKVEMRFSGHRVNRGVPDSIFK